jgi:transcription factor SFP1
MPMFDWLAAKPPISNKTTPASVLESTPSPALTFDDSISSLPSPGSIGQPGTPNHDIDIGDDRLNMPSTSPINIATPSRNNSSSPSSQGQRPVINYPDTDSRTSAMMSGAAYDNSMGRSRQDSFAGAKPIAMNNANRGHDARQRRESVANSLVQGMSWGGVSVGSWIRDE